MSNDAKDDRVRMRRMLTLTEIVNKTHRNDASNDATVELNESKYQISRKKKTEVFVRSCILCQLKHNRRKRDGKQSHLANEYRAIDDFKRTRQKRNIFRFQLISHRSSR